MKKVSAFSVFSGKSNAEKKGKMSTPSGPKGEDTGSLKRASSTPTISKGNRILNAIRGSVRGSGQKVRPSVLKARDQSPHVAGGDSQVSLTVMKTVEGFKVKDKEQGVQNSKPPVDRTKKPPAHPSQPPAKTTLTKDAAVAEPTAGKRSAPFPPETSETGLKGNMAKRQLHLAPALPAKPKIGKKKRTSTESSSASEEGTVPAKKKQKTGGKGANGEAGPAKPVPVAKIQPVGQESEKTEAPYMFDSGVEAARMFECLIHPVTPDRFFRELWEKKPLLVKRHMPNYNQGWFSTAEFDRILRQENIQFGVNVDITSYRDDKRETHNPAGRAYAPLVWDFYQKGCSVRLLNPQTYSRNMWKILSVLQEYFNCSVGANVYLTPAGTQGFAPHYDDIEAFVIQLEGKKHWKLYSPRTDEENLPRFSSNNFTQSEVGTPILNVVLEAGDMLYFPRGTIHQANANEKEHSLHVTFSCYQRNTWGDLLERLVPRALQLAIEENVELRQGLPRDFLNYMGIVHSDKESTERKQFVEKVEGLVRSLVDYLPLDAACDQMGKQAIHDSLPPVLTEQEKACSIHGAGEFWEPAEMQVRGVVELEPDTEVRIIRRGVLRMLTEEDEVRIYHTLENARVYHGNTPQYFDISSEATPAVEFLIDSYPEYVPVDSLPLDTLQEKLDVASLLYDKGLLVTSVPLQTMYDEGTDDSEDDAENRDGGE
ncbi:hypothetical protein BaRGS_00004506 [Batillaria attramentaria]|uniref:Bifunctional lysine-specific demethylase and histidyl-hydroxylase n=1 Tax=Batillaria attramentaria TaxID=370345 RepID=A0ABD0LXR9_9CAEN